jgi:hypothetical protein
MTERLTPTAQGATRGAAVAVVFGLVHLSIMWSQFQPWGLSEKPVMFANIAQILALIFTVMFAAGAAVFVVPRASRQAAIALLCGALVGGGILVADVFAYRFVHDAGCRRIISRGQPVVAAIQRFQVDAGRPPDSLEELVPKYLPSMPSTGAAIAPEFSYSRDEALRWQLVVALPQSIMDDSSLMYTSDHTYGACAYRYRDWALTSCQ